VIGRSVVFYDEVKEKKNDAKGYTHCMLRLLIASFPGCRRIQLRYKGKDEKGRTQRDKIKNRIASGRK